MMDRAFRSLLNSKSKKIEVKKGAPQKREIDEGDIQFRDVGSIKGFRLYTKYKNTLYYVSLSKAGSGKKET